MYAAYCTCSKYILFSCLVITYDLIKYLALSWDLNLSTWFYTLPARVWLTLDPDILIPGECIDLKVDTFSSSSHKLDRNQASVKY